MGWLCPCPGIVWEPIRKRTHTQLNREHSATAVSVRWATVDWFWPKEWNKCALANLHFKKKKKKKAGNKWWNILPKFSQARKSHHQYLVSLLFTCILIFEVNQNNSQKETHKTIKQHREQLKKQKYTLPPAPPQTQPIQKFALRKSRSYTRFLASSRISRTYDWCAPLLHPSSYKLVNRGPP